MMAGAMARISGVGLVKIRVYRFGTARLSGLTYAVCAALNEGADVDDRAIDGQRGHAVGALILADHRHIDHAVDARNQGAAEGGGKILEIQGFHLTG